MSLASSSHLLRSLIAGSCLLLASCPPSRLGARIYLATNEGDPCVQHETGVAGVCAHLTKCPFAIFDLRFRRNPSTCAYGGTWTGVCCRRDDTPSRHSSDNEEVSTAAAVVLSATSPQLPTVETVRKSAPGRVADLKCQEYKLPKPQYGRSFAVGGTLAGAFEFPHMAALGWRDNNGSILFLCGGSLISERFVLTVAHCLVAPRHLGLPEEAPTIVRLGVVNVNKTLAPAEGQLDVLVKNHIPHPSYDPPAKYFDVALLELAEVVSFTKHHRPACLWTYEDIAPHTTATITGWGTTTNRGKDTSPGLMKVDVDLLDSGLCDQLLVSSRSRNWEGFQEHQLCAGALAGGKDACQGDSGGPLQVIIGSVPKNHYSLIGLTSFGRECALPNQPGIYTRVSSFVDWIEDIVWPEYKQN